MKVRLPSGRDVIVEARSGAQIEDDRVDGKPMFAGRFRNAVAKKAFVVRDTDVESLALRDFHALRDVAEKLEVVATDDPAIACDNCGAENAIPTGAELLADIERWYEGSELELTFDDVVFEEVTARRARPFHRALLRPELRFTAEVVRAMGLVAVGNERDPRKLARSMQRMSDADFDRVAEAFDRVAYAPRGYTPIVCAECGTVNEVAAPFEREMGFAEERGVAADAPSLEAFSDRAYAIADEVYAQKKVANIELVVEGGTPPVDIGGTPLLGGYEPQVVLDDGEVGFRISVYYQSFIRDMAGDEIDAELRETIEHELDHHLAYLSGHDAVDEAEREEAEREVREVFGPKRIALAQQQEAKSQARELAIVFVIAIAALAITAIGYVVLF